MVEELVVLVVMLVVSAVLMTTAMMTMATIINVLSDTSGRVYVHGCTAECL